jgi:hypothetical protein
MNVRLIHSFLLAGILGTLSAAAQTDDPAIAPQAPPNAVPEGTTFLIQLNDKVDTSHLRAGDKFTARLAEDLSTGNDLTLFRDSKIKGHVSAVSPGLHTRLLLSFDQIKTEHGWVPLLATVVSVPSEHGLRPTGAEGEIERNGMSKERMAEAIATGAGAGAAAGAATGKSHGAVTGAGAGAAAAAEYVFTADRNLILEKDTVLEIRLDRNLQLPPR